MKQLPAGAGSRGYRKVLVAGGVGTVIEVYDLLIYGYLAAILAGQFFPSSDPTAALLATFAIFALGSFVRPLGAVVFGHVGDRFGRRPALAFSLLLMTVATTAFGLLPTYAAVGLLAPVLMVLCRILQGLSASAELPGALLLMLEHAPADRRGLTAAIGNVANGVALAAAAAVSLLLSTTLTPDQLAGWGWRVAFLIGAPLGLVGLYVRTRLLDSPEFVALGEQARQGRAPIARAVRTAKRGLVLLTVWSGAHAIAGYTLTVAMPAYLIRTGLSPADAYTANLVAVLASTGFALLGGYLIDRFPLRRVALVIMGGTAVTAVPAFLIITRYPTLIGAVAGQTLCSMFVGPALAVGAVLAMKLFPTGIRFTSFAVPAGIAIGLFGSTAPFVSTWLTAVTGSPLAPGFYVLAAASVGTLVVFLGGTASWRPDR